MPYFAVTKGQDAFVEYVTIIEADSPQQAFQQAHLSSFTLNWRPSGSISEFDHFEIFDHSIEQVKADSLEEAEAIHLSGAIRTDAN